MSHFKPKKSTIIVQWAQNVDLHCCTKPLPKVQSVVMCGFCLFGVFFKLPFWLKSGMNKSMLTFCWLWTCVTCLSESWLLNLTLWVGGAFYIWKSPICTESALCAHTHPQCICLSSSLLEVATSPKLWRGSLGKALLFFHFSSTILLHITGTFWLY